MFGMRKNKEKKNIDEKSTEEKENAKENNGIEAYVQREYIKKVTITIKGQEPYTLFLRRVGISDTLYTDRAGAIYTVSESTSPYRLERIPGGVAVMKRSPQNTMFRDEEGREYNPISFNDDSVFLRMNRELVEYKAAELRNSYDTQFAEQFGITKEELE